MLKEGLGIPGGDRYKGKVLYHKNCFTRDFAQKMPQRRKTFVLDFRTGQGPLKLSHTTTALGGMTILEPLRGIVGGIILVLVH